MTISLAQRAQLSTLVSTSTVTLVSESNDAVPLAEVVGINARRIRGAATGDRVTLEARRYGLNWGTGRISDLESGRVAPTLGTLIAVAAALEAATGTPTTVLDLVAWDGLVLVNQGFAIYGTNGVVKAITEGHVGHLDDRLTSVELAQANNAGEAELKAAKSLGIDVDSLESLALKTWGRSMRAERDHRAGPDASAQKRGRITRLLLDELKMELSGK
ncbi:Uncharacterised protein [Mycobacteroides abscessus]|uniref:hypothetical protein n=1 Tax=Mycobacteroides abscessus TaxID=36809 RepID=UPI0005E46040|nr:hypothetical protein [Mycobacteroides abscessus]CPV67637.1 Uncharacterised protein [Mycobacteroides abscessus]SHQ51061.1 Uncharacterised protein [Mycobacteroides abscessus subsp. abscessus]SHR10661.1 Uncharacterised protein [Mycobacteroides abscessus subsp. abscessus]SHR11807.1 Uncharacterised protein [Mycobacteroides abscessus subsp. abscessus]SHR55436.1 Uncharacterised protein [Mycobacteroides abscessus subsp. abscessus]